MLLSYKPFKKDFHHLQWKVPIIVESYRHNKLLITLKVKVLIGLIVIDVHAATAEKNKCHCSLLSWLPAEVKTGHSFTKLSLCTPVISVHRHACHQLKNQKRKNRWEKHHQLWLWIANMQTMFVKFILIFNLAENITYSQNITQTKKANNLRKHPVGHSILF